MRLDKLAGQRESESQRGLTPGDTRLVEAGEHLFLLLRRNSRAVIDDDNRGIVFIAAGLEPDVTALVSIGDGVAEDMLDGFPKSPGIADDAPGAWFQCQVQLLLLLC